MPLKTFVEWERFQRNLLDRVLALWEQPDEVEKRIEICVHPFRPILTSPIEDEPLGREPLFFVDFCPRQDLRGMHDGPGEPVFPSMMKKDGIQDRAGHRPKPEGDVREAQDDSAFGESLRDQTNTLKRLVSESTIIFHAGRDGEGQRIEEKVLLIQSPLAGEQIVNTRGDL